ncbi:uncharacterized protein LOC132736502 [Ruditapes philippinarum]|uniref:uncharacterized protein LOC132736502 n=1 Tax=Ruditapes philippinarum TaxID=129788 RepID=UPI00295BA51C|nr:uncharacterized protein LOC132736502 [Ruditapes philippinarum]
MGIPVQQIFIGVVTLAYFVNVIVLANGEDQLICTGYTFYKVKKNGQAFCKECPSCIGGGIGWDTTETRIKDEHGFRSCYKCEKCKPETFRVLGSYDSKCEQCGLDCVAKNRYGSVRCGGGNPGHCGECISGYYATSKESNSRCTLKPTEGNEDVKTVTEKTTTLEHRLEENRRQPNPLADVPIWIPSGILFIAFLAVIACAIISARWQKRNKTSAQSNIAYDSKRALISNGSSLDGENLETDGDNDVKVRGERPEAVTINEIEAMGFSSSSKRLESPNFDRILHKDDKTLDVVANNIHGERRHEMFETYLKLPKPKTSPEEEKFHKNLCSFPAYILEVLKIWLQYADKEATLKNLCKALEMASFNDVVGKVLDLPENQPGLGNVDEC